MATRSLKEANLPAREMRATRGVGGARGLDGAQIGPSPFPLLILALIIAVILMIKVRADDGLVGVGIRVQQEGFVGHKG
jgi:hypothetical protein